MKKPIVEFIGTFFLVFAVGSTAAIAGFPGALAPLAIAATLTALIYAGGHISGAHYNPAVTIALYLRGNTRSAEVIPYLVAQIVAAVLAAICVGLVHSPAELAAASIPAGPSLLAEFLFTFALVFVILNVATAKGTEGNSFYGLAIGLIVAAGAYAVGPVSAAVFNPAVAIGGMTLGILPWSAIWIYLIANFGGALVAAIVFRIVSDD
ncbi:MAG: aquaporin [Verrucomicrobiota bacterium]